MLHCPPHFEWEIFYLTVMTICAYCIPVEVSLSVLLVTASVLSFYFSHSLSSWLYVKKIILFLGIGGEQCSTLQVALLLLLCWACNMLLRVLAGSARYLSVIIIAMSLMLLQLSFMTK